jgi:hypothetical protein
MANALVNTLPVKYDREAEARIMGGPDLLAHAGLWADI